MGRTLVGDIADRLRTRIEAGEFTPGQQLPSERKLATEEGVSRITARDALRQLVTHGLAIAHQGSGYIVRGSDRLRWVATDSERGDELGGPPPNDSWSRQIRLQGHTPGEEILAVEHVPAPALLARYLEVDAGTKLVVRRRLRTVDGEPFMLADSYYLAADVAGTPIEQPGDVQPGVFKIFEKMGRAWQKPRRDHISSRPPTLDEVRQLNLPDATPVLQLIRVSRDHQAVPVRLGVFVVRSDKGEIEHNYHEQ